MIRRGSPALGVIPLLAIAAPGLAQTALGTLRGAVLDPHGAVLPGVTITVRR